MWTDKEYPGLGALDRMWEHEQALRTDACICTGQNVMQFSALGKTHIVISESVRGAEKSITCVAGHR